MAGIPLTKELICQVLEPTTHFEHLDFSSMNISDIEKGALDLTNEKVNSLYSLNLSHNKIKYLPPDFKTGKNLYVLDLSYNNLQGFDSIKEALLECV